MKTIINIKKQIRRMYAVSFFSGLSLTGSVWILFLLGRGFSMLEIGAAEGFFHVVSLLFEVPSGAIADLIGRKRVLIAGRFCMVISALLMIASNNLLILCAAMAFCALSYNLNSGTEDALVYDSLKSAGEEDRFLKVNANKGLLFRIADALSNILSFVSIAIGYVFSYLFNSVVALSSAMVMTGLKEPDSDSSHAKPTLRSFPATFAQHMRVSVSFLVKNPRIAARMFLDCAIATMYTLVLFFIQQHFVSSGFPARFVGIPLLTIGLGGFAGNRIAHAFAGKARYRTIALVSLLFGGAGAMLAASRLLPLSILGAIVLGFFAALMELATSARVHAQIPSAQRATLVSVGSMMFSVIMVAASPLTGLLCDRFSTSAAFLMQGSFLLALFAVCTATAWIQSHRFRAERE